MLLPSLGKAKDRAKMTACAANLRQIGLGFAMYGNDNNDYFPPDNVSNPGAADVGTYNATRWFDLVADAASATSTYDMGGADGLGYKLFRCPAKDPYFSVRPRGNDCWGSYGYNVRASGQRVSSFGGNLAKTFLVCDSSLYVQHNYLGWNFQYIRMMGHLEPGASTGLINMIAADGHCFTMTDGNLEANIYTSLWDPTVN